MVPVGVVPAVFARDRVRLAARDDKRSETARLFLVFCSEVIDPSDASVKRSKTDRLFLVFCSAVVDPSDAFVACR